MDELDRKILYKISEDARGSHNVLAKEIRCSREVFDYRIKQLKESGIIVGSQARINLSNFVYGGYVVLVQSSGLNLETEKKILNKLTSSSKTQYIGKISGEYDIIIGFTIKSLSELSSYVDFVNCSFGVYKSKMSFLTMVEEIKDSFRDLFSSKSEINDIVSMPEFVDKQEIDDIDRDILLALGKNSDVPSWELADKSRLTDVAVRKRIQRLVDKKIILNFRTMLDLTKLDYQSYFIFVKSNFKNEDISCDFIKFLQSSNNITYSVKTIGEYDYIITLVVKENLELKDFVYKLKAKYSNMILEIHTSNIFEMLYHTQLAKNFLN